MESTILSHQLQARVNLMSELQQRLSHGFKRFEYRYTWQHEAYELKYQQALNVTVGLGLECSLVKDYAEETNLDLPTAAHFIVNKYQNRVQTIRKLERLRIRFQQLIRAAKNKEEFAIVRSQMEEDLFLSMMM
jgi:hypothetical protein